jgi:hypothetical protein
VEEEEEEEDEEEEEEERRERDIFRGEREGCKRGKQTTVRVSSSGR